MLFTRYDKTQKKLIYDIEAAAAVPEYLDLIQGIGENAFELLVLSANIFSPFNKINDGIEDNTKRALMGGRYENVKDLENICDNPIYRAAYLLYEKTVNSQLNAIKILRYYEESLETLLNKETSETVVGVDKKITSINNLKKNIDDIWAEIFKQERDKAGNEQMGKAKEKYESWQDKTVFEKSAEEILSN